jgi:peptidoglycan hydrolase-like protein with peptidoglycan-binding domain
VGTPATDYLSLKGSWVSTPWSGGRLVIDQPKALAWRGELQSITDAGVVAAPGGRVAPAAMSLMLGADMQSFAGCAVTRAEMLDGRSHGLEAVQGDPLRLYCRDGSWLEGVSDGRRDLGTFRPVAGSASQRDLVRVPGLWSASADYGADGAPAALAFTFRDEPARLGAGRFDFDTLREIAAPFAGRIELLTDSGWWHSGSRDLALRDTERPALPLAPRSVAGFTLDLSRRNGAAGLCLTLDDGTGQFWAGGSTGLEAAGTCREDRGRDALWQWWQEGGKPFASANSLNGVVLGRLLAAGRFSDLVLSGPPLLVADGTLLVPGAQGVLVLDPGGGTPRGIYALAPEGALTRSASGEPVWLGPSGPMLLRGEGGAVEAGQLACPGLAALSVLLPEGNRLLRLQPGGAGWVDALISTGEERVQALMDCRDPAQSRLWSHRRDVSDHSRSLSMGAASISEMQIAWQQGTVALSDGVTEAILPAGADVAALRGMASPLGGGALFAIDDRRLIEISLAPAISALAAYGRAVPPPVAPVSDPAVAAAAPEAAPDSALPETVRAAEGLASLVPADDQPQPPVASARSRAEEAVYDPVAVQAALGRILGRRIAADGIIGPQSRSAIAEWQQQIGSEATGFLSEAQLVLLLGGTDQ